MRLIELLHKRQLMDGDGYGKSLFGVGFNDLFYEDETKYSKRYKLRFLLRSLNVNYSTANDKGDVQVNWLECNSILRR